MWKVPSPNLNIIFEPEEVRLLKKQLANISCKCKVCVKRRSKEFCRDVYHHREIQTNETLSSFDRFIQVTPEHIDDDVKICQEYLVKGVMCPGCYVALNLKTNIFKDKETTIESKTFSRDKSSGKMIKFIDKTTSAIQFSFVNNRDGVYYDSTTEYSYEDSFSKFKNERNAIETVWEQEENDKSFNGCFLCLDTFMDLIRPPLLN